MAEDLQWFYASRTIATAESKWRPPRTAQIQDPCGTGTETCPEDWFPPNFPVLKMSHCFENTTLPSGFRRRMLVHVNACLGG
jgi:hypothetical protein